MEMSTVGREAGYEGDGGETLALAGSELYTELTISESSSGSQKDSVVHVAIVTQTHHIQVEHPAQLLLCYTKTLHIHTPAAAGHTQTHKLQHREPYVCMYVLSADITVTALHNTLAGSFFHWFGKHTAYTIRCQFYQYSSVLNFTL